MRVLHTLVLVIFVVMVHPTKSNEEFQILQLFHADDQEVEEYRYRRYKVRPYHKPSNGPNVFDLLQTLLLGKMLILQWIAFNSLENLNLDNLPTQEQIATLIGSVNSIGTQLTTLSFSLTGVLTPLTGILTALTAAFGGINLFITAVVGFIRGLLGLGRSGQQQDIFQDFLRLTLEKMPFSGQSTQDVLSTVIHGFPLKDVHPSKKEDIIELPEEQPVILKKKKEDFSQVDKVLWLSSKKDQVNFYQYEFKKKASPGDDQP